MQYRTLGKTGLRVSALAYGASPLGGVFRDVDESEGVRTVHSAIEHGINLIDVAPYYGLTKAEAVLGKALREIPRIKYILATKVGRYGKDEFDFTAARTTASVDESLARLGSGHIDLIQVHDIEFGDLDLIINETLPTLRSLQKSGKVRFIGITGLPLAHFRYVIDRAPVDTVLSYCHYGLNDSSLVDDLVPYLAQRNVGVISASPLGMGLLTDRGVADWHPAPEDIRHTCAKAAALCRLKKADISKLAIQYSVANPAIATTLVGTASPDNLAKNVRWIQEPIDQELLGKVMNLLKPIHNQTWPSGKPLPPS